MTIRGSQPDSFLGPVATLDDLNGDGVKDFVVCEPGNFLVSATEPGRAYVFSGRDRSLLYEFVGDAAGDCFGACPGNAGDVDGDGVCDVIIGAFQYIDFLVTGPGYARIFSGADGSVIRTFHGTVPNGGFGASVSGAGDVDADGFGDVLIGSQWEDANGVSYAGAVRLFSGKTGSELFWYGGSSFLSYTGYALATLGDVNGDGHSEFVVGSFGEIVNGKTLGTARIISGADLSVIHTLTGSLEWGDFAITVAAGGDIDGDGVGDFVVGANAVDSGVELGRAYVYSGADGSFLRMHGGSAPEDGFGTAVACNSDLDGDGVVDVIVGAPSVATDEGMVGAVYCFSGKTGMQLMSEYGKSGGYDPQFGGTFGLWVDGLNDANGDGRDEFLVGASAEQEKPGDPVGSAYMLTLGDYPASWSNYGDGWPGTHCIPAFTCGAAPILGTTLTVALENSLGASTNGLVIVGFAKASIPIASGGMLLVATPWIVVPLAIPAVGLLLDASIPSDVVFAGLEMDAQAIELDPGAVGGLSLSPGLELILGG